MIQSLYIGQPQYYTDPEEPDTIMEVPGLSPSELEDRDSNTEVLGLSASASMDSESRVEVSGPSAPDSDEPCN